MKSQKWNDSTIYPAANKAGKRDKLSQVVVRIVTKSKRKSSTIIPNSV